MVCAAAEYLFAAYTRKGSDRGKPQSTVMCCMENIHAHSNRLQSNFTQETICLCKETNDRTSSGVLVWVHMMPPLLPPLGISGMAASSASRNLLIISKNCLLYTSPSPRD